MSDITSPKWLYVKGVLFLVCGLMASVLLLVESPTVRTAVLLIIAVWSFCRLYYFMFYVIEHYIDPTHKYAGILDFLKYSRQRWLGKAPTGEPPQA